MSDLSPTQQLVKNKLVNAPIKYKKIVMVGINWKTVRAHPVTGYLAQIVLPKQDGIIAKYLR